NPVPSAAVGTAAPPGAPQKRPSFRITVRTANSYPQPDRCGEVIHRGSARSAPSYAVGHGGGTRRRRAAGNPRRIDMSQGAFVTLVGYVAQEPSIRTTKTGKTATDLRVGITP